MPTLSIPDATCRRLAARAVEQNTPVDDLAARLLSDDGAGPPGADPVPTLAEVRAVTAKLPGSLAADFVADHEDR